MESPVPQANMQPVSQPASPAQTVVKEKFLPEWIIVTFLLVFPPVAWYIMWREKHYHSWFTSLLTVSGILSLLTFVPMLYVIPQIGAIYRNLNVQGGSPFLVAVWVYGGMAFSVLELLFAFSIWRKVKKHGFVSDQLLLSAVAVLCVTYFLATVGSVLMGIQMILPIYNILRTSQGF